MGGKLILNSGLTLGGQAGLVLARSMQRSPSEYSIQKWFDGLLNVQVGWSF